MKLFFQSISRCGLVLGASLLAGCASVATQELTVRAQLPSQAVWAASAWGGATPTAPVGPADDTLTADTAVRMAFTTSPQARALRAAFLVEVSAIDVAAAPGGLHFSWARLRPADGLAKLALALSVPLEEWLTLPVRQRQAYWLRAASAQRAAFATLQMERQVREAWAAAVATQRRAALLARAAETAELSAELATRYRDAGNLPPHDWNVQQQAAAVALTAAAEAGVAAAEARATLANLLGVPSTDPRLILPQALPSPPALESADNAPDAATLTAVLSRRLDLLALRSEAMAQQIHARSRRLWSRLPAVAAGVERERETDGTRLTGPAIDAAWSPSGGAEARGIAAQSALADANAATLSVEVANELRLRALAYRRALDLDGLLGTHLTQLQAASVAAAQRQQAFMLAGPFDLLEKRRLTDELSANAEQQRLAAWLAWYAWQQASGVAP
jgi:cobalt-zinc-cadmium efflux system outer membrane protein